MGGSVGLLGVPAISQTVAESATERGQKVTIFRICHTRHIAVDSLNYHELVDVSTGAWFCHTLLGNTYQRMQCVE